MYICKQKWEIKTFYGDEKYTIRHSFSLVTKMVVIMIRRSCSRRRKRTRYVWHRSSPGFFHLIRLLSELVFVFVYVVLYSYSSFVFVHNEGEKYVWHSSNLGFSDLIRLFWLFLLLGIHLMMMIIMSMMMVMTMQLRFSDFISLPSAFLLFILLNSLIQTHKF